MRCTAWVLAGLMLATGCYSTSAKVVGGMGVGFVGGGAAALGADDTGVVVLGYTALVVGVYMGIAAGVLETRAEERSWRSHAGGAAPDDPYADPYMPSAPSAPSSAATEPRTPAAVEERRRTSHSGYDRTGSYAGRADESGTYYDRTGTYAGRVDSTGSYYDRTGASAGRVDSSGSVYDRTGASAGRVDSSGAMYDETGTSVGRIDADGSIYDRTGTRVGHVDGSCDEQCRRETAGRILIEP